MNAAFDTAVQHRNEVHWQNCAPWDHGDQNRLSLSALWFKMRTRSLKRGVICGTLAKLYRWHLGLAGVQSSVVSLIGGSEAHLVHAAVDVNCNGTWVLMDPYFNCSFRSQAGVWLSSLGVKAALERKETPVVSFNGQRLNWMNAWKAWQKSLRWIVEAALSASARGDAKLSDGEQVFFSYLFPWLKAGSPNTSEFGWKRSSYSYWEYFNKVKGGH